MKKVYECDNVMLAGHIHSLLQSNRIDCHVRNMNLSGGIGELPINECWPEVWVNDDRDYELAQKLISHVLEPTQAGTDWICSCGENIEGQFEVCWSCGKDRPITES